MKLFYGSVAGLAGLVGLIWAISSLWHEPSTAAVQAIFVNSDESLGTVCYRVTQYQVMGYRWGHTTEFPSVTIDIPEIGEWEDCPSSQESIIFDCLDFPLEVCKERLEAGVVKRRPPDFDELIEQ